MIYPKIGIRPVIDGRQFGVREDLEQQTMDMAYAAQKLIESRLRYPDGTKVQCVVAPKTIGGGAEAYECETFFQTQNVCATLSVTPCWCYGSETMDLNPLTIKAVWGFNGTERPGAVYLAACMAAHAQRGLPAFAIYGKDVQDKWQSDVPESGEIPEKKAYMPIPADVEEKILRFAKCAVAVGVMRNKAYVGLGGVSMGIAGSYCNSHPRLRLCCQVHRRGDEGDHPRCHRVRHQVRHRGGDHGPQRRLADRCRRSGKE